MAVQLDDRQPGEGVFDGPPLPNPATAPGPAPYSLARLAWRERYWHLDLAELCRRVCGEPDA